MDLWFRNVRQQHDQNHKLQEIIREGNMLIGFVGHGMEKICAMSLVSLEWWAWTYSVNVPDGLSWLRRLRGPVIDPAVGGMYHPKIHLISSGLPWHSIALQWSEPMLCRFLLLLLRQYTHSAGDYLYVSNMCLSLYLSSLSSYQSSW